FYHCPCPPPSLPSFPTRRSSDLALALRLLRRCLDRLLADRGRDVLAADRPSARAEVDEDLRAHVLPDVDDIREDMGSEVFVHFRSEEHTSEFQSRGYLVCRLRLE